MSTGRSSRKSIWDVGKDRSNYYQKFQEVIDSKEPPSPPKILDSPKFPDTPPAKEDASGKPITSSSGGSQVPQEDKKFLKLPSQNTMNFAQTLNKPNEYPQMEGPFEVELATPDELEMVNRFVQTFEFWVMLARLFFKTKFYKKEWESKNKFDLVFMQLDPILINMGKSSMYVHLTEIGIPSISGCNLDNFKVDVQGERSKEPHKKVLNKIRRDREYKIAAEISCASTDGKASYALTSSSQQPDPKAEKGTFKFTLKELKANIGVIIIKIDESFETKEIRYRPPKISLTYNLKGVDITVDKAPQASPLPPKDIERMFNEFKNKELMANKDKIAQRLVEPYVKRLSPLIVQMRWIHQLHDIMYFTMVNEPDKIIPEFSKIQTRLVEVVFFALQHTKIRELIFEALEEETYEPFKKLVYFRECPELRTAKKVNSLVANSNKMEADDIFGDASDSVEYEMSDKPKKFKRIVKLQFYLMRFFTESILI